MTSGQNKIFIKEGSSSEIRLYNKTRHSETLISPSDVSVIKAMT